MQSIGTNPTSLDTLVNKFEDAKSNDKSLSKTSDSQIYVKSKRVGMPFNKHTELKLSTKEHNSKHSNKLDQTAKALLETVKEQFLDVRGLDGNKIEQTATYQKAVQMLQNSNSYITLEDLKSLQKMGNKELKMLQTPDTFGPRVDKLTQDIKNIKNSMEDKGDHRMEVIREKMIEQIDEMVRKTEDLPSNKHKTLALGKIVTAATEMKRIFDNQKNIPLSVSEIQSMNANQMMDLNQVFETFNAFANMSDETFSQLYANGIIDDDMLTIIKDLNISSLNPSQKEKRINQLYERMLKKDLDLEMIKNTTEQAESLKDFIQVEKNALPHLREAAKVLTEMVECKQEFERLADINEELGQILGNEQNLGVDNISSEQLEKDYLELQDMLDEPNSKQKSVSKDPVVPRLFQLHAPKVEEELEEVKPKKEKQVQII